MIDEIKFHLSQTFRSDGGDATLRVREAEEYLGKCWMRSEFYGCVFQIICEKSNQSAIRVSAILLLANLVKEKWRDLCDEIRNRIFEFLIFVLDDEHDEVSLNALKKLVRNFIVASFSEGCGGLIEFIDGGLKSNNHNKIFVSLMMSNYVADLFFPLCDGKIELYTMFSDLVLPCLYEIICNWNLNIKLLPLCFKIIRKLSAQSVPLFFQSSPEFLLKLFLIAINIIKDNYNSVLFNPIIISIVEFYNDYVYRNYISVFDDSVLIDVFNSVLVLLNFNSFIKIKYKCIQFIRWSLSNESLFRIISVNIDDFIQNIVLPIYELSKQDIDDVKNDPFNFIINFHSISLEKLDIRSVLYEAIRMKAKVSPILFQAIQKKFLDVVQNQSLNVSSFYSICYIYSAMSYHIDIQVYELLVNYLDSDCYIILISTLIALRNLKVSTQIVLKIVNLLNHPILIVKYFASLNLAEYLPRIVGNDKLFIIQECKSQIDIILKSYFLIIQEFYDYDFVELLQIYIKFFGDELFIFATNLISDAYVFYTNCLIIKNPVSGDIILSSISLLLQKLQGKGDLCQNICSSLLQQILNDLDHYPFYSLDSILILISNIIAILPNINEDFIEIFSIINKYLLNYPDSSCIVYHNLIIRLFNSSIQIPIELIQMCDDILNTFDDNCISSTFSLFSVIFLLYQSENKIKQYIQKLIPIVKKTFASEDTKALFTSMIICDPLLTFQLLGNNYISFIEEWSESCTYIELFSVIVYSNHVFDPETLSSLVEKSKQIYFETQFFISDDNYTTSPVDQIQPILLPFFDKGEIEKRFFNLFP